LHLAYFDEVKVAPPGQPFHWLCAILVDANDVAAIEAEVSALAVECFGNATLTRDTEFHAAAIFNRSENFKHWTDPVKRVEVLKRLFRILDKHDVIGKVYVRLDPRRMAATDNVDERAFMFFVERIDMALADRQSMGLLIGDFESDRFSSVAARNLSAYREGGTPYQFGREIKQLIDTVHFTHSHHSRLLQLADCFAWSQQLCHTASGTATGLRAELAEWVRTETNLNGTHRYKHWPPESAPLLRE